MDQTGEVVRLARGHDIAVHHVQRIAGLPHVQARQRAPGAADRVEGAVGAGLEQLGVAERLAHQLLGLLDRLLGHVLQRQPAERQRDAGVDLVAVDFGELQRAAAEVADQTIRPMKSAHDAERAQLGLALAGNDLDLGAADALRLGDEGLAVLGVATGGGRHHPQRADLHAVAQHAEALERTERLVHGVGGEQSRGLHLAAETGQHLLVEDRRRAARQALIGDEAHRVRADVDDGNRLAVVEASLGGLHGERAPLNRGRGGVQDCAATIL